MTNSEARKRHQAAQAPVSRPNAPNRGVDTPETANGPQIANLRRDAQVVREHIPSGYHVAHRVADAVPLLLDEITRLRSALNEARRYADHTSCVESYSALLARAVAAEAALAAVRALVGPANPRSATAGSAYSTGRWDAFAEVRAVLESEVEDGVFGDPDIHARLTRAALATTTTPEETQP